MNLDFLINYILEATGTFNPQIAAFLFLVCAVGELWFAFPYILETIWLLTGYQMAQGELKIWEMISIWLVAQAGRQTGSIVLYYSGLAGLRPLRKLYNKYLEPRLPKNQKFIPGFIMKRLTNPSPFSVAFGRLLGLRFPLTLMMSARRRLYYLSLGVLFSSIVWDGIYLILGFKVGNTFMPDPGQMLLFSLAGLTALYIVTLGVRLVLRACSSRKVENTQ